MVPSAVSVANSRFCNPCGPLPITMTCARRRRASRVIVPVASPKRITISASSSPKGVGATLRTCSWIVWRRAVTCSSIVHGTSITRSGSRVWRGGGSTTESTMSGRASRSAIVRAARSAAVPPSVLPPRGRAGAMRARRRPAMGTAHARRGASVHGGNRSSVLPGGGQAEDGARRPTGRRRMPDSRAHHDVPSFRAAFPRPGGSRCSPTTPPCRSSAASPCRASAFT